MRKLPVFILCLATHFCYGQLNLTDLQSGKYYENKLKGDFIGSWNCVNCNETFEFLIDTAKRHIKKETIDIHADFLIVTIRRMLKNGKDLAGEYKEQMELISLNDDSTFSGYFKDPVSGNNVKIKVKAQLNGNLSFEANLPEMDVDNNIYKGIGLPQMAVLQKQK